MCFDQSIDQAKVTKYTKLCRFRSSDCRTYFSCIVRSYISTLDLVKFEIIPFYLHTSGFTSSTKWHRYLKLLFNDYVRLKMSKFLRIARLGGKSMILIKRKVCTVVLESVFRIVTRTAPVLLSILPVLYYRSVMGLSITTSKLPVKMKNIKYWIVYACQ